MKEIAKERLWLHGNRRDGGGDRSRRRGGRQLPLGEWVLVGIRRRGKECVGVENEPEGPFYRGRKAVPSVAYLTEGGGGHYSGG